MAEPLKRIEAEGAKVDGGLGVVFGYAIVSRERGPDGALMQHFDVQGDHIPEDAMLEATLEFMDGDRPSLAMHRGGPVGRVVFGFPLTEDVAEAMSIRPERTGFIVGVRPSPEVLRRFESGELTGFSIGGRRIEDEEVKG